MTTTVMVSKETRDQLNRLKDLYGVPSVDAAIQRVLAEATPDATTLYKRNKRKVDAVCKKYGLKTLIAFGSRVRDDRTPASDLDLVTEFPKGTSLFDVVHITDELSAAFGVKVELSSRSALHRFIQEDIDKEGTRLV